MNLQDRTKQIDRETGSPQTNDEAIPIIDIAGLFSDSLVDRQQVANALGNACRTIGFCYIINHQIPTFIIDEAYRAAKEFFALPSEQKYRYHLSRHRHYRGYFGIGELRSDLHEQTARDLFEGYEISLELPQDDPDYLAGNFIYGPNIWPEHPSQFREAIYSYYEAILALGRLLFRGFALALALPETYFDDKITKPMAQLAVLHYPPQPQPIDSRQIGVGAHTDYECFTLLTQSASGLQVQNSLGQWIAVPPIPNSFVVNIGDSLARWSNDTFVSAIHRVINLSGQDRFSIPFFFGVDYNTLIYCLESCQSREYLPKHPPIQAGEWTVANLKAFCAYREQEY
jgi:isopenicillin N synthase-like dioxygenase